MAYEKRVCVLKQVKKGFSADGGALTGAVYAERLGSDLTLTPKIAGIAPLREGRYAFAVWVGGQTYCVEYGASMRIANAPSLSRGISVLLCFIRAEAQPIAYGACGEAPRGFEALMNAFSENAPARKQRQPFSEDREAQIVSAAAEEEEADAPPFRERAYDDEAIATDDYYRLSESGEDARAGVRLQEENGADADQGGAFEDDGALSPRPVGRTLAYYREVRERLDDAFARFPKDERLNAAFPASEWVSSNGALIGIIYEEGIPRYLCVAASASEETPEEMKARGVFVPATCFSDDEGYYVVFQDADTGEYVRVSDS